MQLAVPEIFKPLFSQLHFVGQYYCYSILLIVLFLHFISIYFWYRLCFGCVLHFASLSDKNPYQ